MKTADEIDIDEIRAIAQELEDFARNIEDAINAFSSAYGESDDEELEDTMCDLRDLEGIIPRLRGIPGDLAEQLGFEIGASE